MTQVGQWLRRTFMAGFFLTVPLAVSIVALVWLVQFADSVTSGLSRRVATMIGLEAEELAYAGIRVTDIRDAYRPEEVAAFVPPEPKTLADRRPNRAKVIQTCDVYVTADGVIYSTDFNGGMYILEYKG